MVEVDANAVAGGFLGVDVEPDAIDFQFRDCAPAETFERRAAFGDGETVGAAFGGIPADSLAA